MEIFKDLGLPFKPACPVPVELFLFPISPTRTPELNLALLLRKAHTMSAVQTEAKEAVTIRDSQFGDSENIGGPEGHRQRKG